MTAVAVSLIAGIAAFRFPPFFPFSIVILLIFALFLLSFLKLHRRRILILFIVFGLGLSYTYLRHDNRSESDFNGYFHSESLAGSALIEGTVSDLPEVSDGKVRFTINDVQINGRKLFGKVRIFANKDAYGYAPDRPDYGDRISATAKLRAPSVLKNPGLYSYDLKRDGIFAVGYISGFRIKGKGKGLSFLISQKRQRLGDIIDNSLSEENASLHKAIIPGLKRGIGQSMREAFSTTGLAHLLSISGTHFGLLAFIIFKFIKMITKLLPGNILTRTTLLLTPTQIAVIFTMPVLIMYAVMSGASTPTVRSFIMVFIYMSALFLGRRGEWLNSLSIAAVIILLWNPEALFGLSFQLSFLAVFSIGYVLERRNEDEVQNEEDKKKNTDFRDFIMKTAGKTRAAMLITIAAVLGTAPIVVLFFKQFPLISPVTNLIVTPLICFVILPLGFFSGFTALLFNMDTMPLNGLIDSITHFALVLIQLFSEIPYSSLHVPNPSFILIILYFLSLFLLLRGKYILQGPIWTKVISGSHFWTLGRETRHLLRLRITGSCLLPEAQRVKSYPHYHLKSRTYGYH
jgi:competence protein ComEC